MKKLIECELVDVYSSRSVDTTRQNVTENLFFFDEPLESETKRKNWRLFSFFLLRFYDYIGVYFQIQ